MRDVSVAQLVAVVVGGGLGSLLRFVVQRVSAALVAGSAFGGVPVGTVAVNVVGSFVMGVLAVLFVRAESAEPWRTFALTGVLGGFTTFSAFSLDAATLWQERGGVVAVGYVAVSVVVSLAAVAAGMAVAR